MAPHVDPNLDDFRDRLSRIEAAHAKGFGSKAPRALGRPRHAPSPRRGRRVLGPVLVLLVVGVMLKGALLWRIGPDSYDARVATLMQGEVFDRMGGLLMQADPVTRAVAWVCAELLRGV
ncbi:hypothetical protein SAMN05878503_103209 [Cereibacter ovatus]|uniref:Uncharacterized protein n=1 Tax=Cereibacter ovatus TaxID=439529 RepID=A0A285CNV2_9RHOB|nr:hypothetical protein [Cereibacter ovatus]SNX69222.1 hypothetical protein SAMN05878503_103209 [Cereibacter ovatus]